MNDQSIKKPLGILVLVLLAIGIVYVVGLTRNIFTEHKYIGRPDQQIYTIAISGEGKVTAIPDIAEVTVGVQNENKTVEAAQKENTTKMNTLITELKNLGVDAKDINTNRYNIYPQYDYYDGRQVLRGYSVDQAVTIKIRDLSKVGQIIEKAGSLGANQVSGLNFTTDEPEEILQQAREKALLNAKSKAESLATVAGVKIGKLVSFSESNIGTPSYYKDFAVFEGGYGGGAGIAPSVEPGSQEYIVNVTVIYEVL